KKVIFECMACGYQSPKWMAKCPNCGGWNQMEEIIEQKSTSPKHGVRSRENSAKVQKLNEIKHETTPRIKTNSAEFNRVLGGGIVPGSLVLIGGDPGIGKSPLLLQVSSQLAEKQMTVLYVSGEESTRQTKLHADRLGIAANSLDVLAATSVLNIISHSE